MRRIGSGPRQRSEPRGEWAGEQTWPGESDWGRRAGPKRGRPAVYDPWRERRSLKLPPALPTVPVALLALLAIVLAFVLGRATAGGGGGGDVSTANGVVTSSTTTTTLPPLTHVVKKGETLASIAAQYGVTVNDIAILNNIGNINIVYVGLRLKIPAPNQALTSTTIASTTSTTKKKGK